MANTGAVTIFRNHRADLTITENYPRIDGVAERNDRFGSALLGAAGGLLIGTPGENVGSVVNAGAVTSLTIHCGHTEGDEQEQELGGGRVFTQRTKGVSGAAETGDAFGATLTSVGRTFIVGVPGESIGDATAAGALTLLPAPGGAPVAAGSRHLSQSSAGVPGASEPGDRFGAALTFFEGAER